MILDPVPFNRPGVVGRELEYIGEALRRQHLSGDGHFTRSCERLLGEILGGPRVLLTTSCTHALEMAALLLELGPGDEFLVPSFTFPSTANAFVLRGAKPVFVDIRADSLNLDERLLEDAVTERTKAIIVVHYAGIACEMDAILEVGRRRGIPVVEDNAHGLFGRYKGRPLGTFGCLAAQSFHETKNVSCGEGGALVVNDPAYIERAEIVREKGTDRSRFFRGQVDKYTWIDVGSSYIPSDLLAAFLLGQLEQHEWIQEKRLRLWQAYRDAFREWADRRGVRLPACPAHSEHPAHLFYLVFPSLADRERFIAHLGARGITALFHYLPLHLSRMGRSFGGGDGLCPVTERVSECLVRLPLFFGLESDEEGRVVDAVVEF